MPRYFELDVSLRDIEPKIRRRFLLRDNATFLDLHDAIQDAGDWGSDHLFGFYRKQSFKEAIAGCSVDDQSDEDEPPAEDVSLSSYFTKRGQKCLYLYDFGDSWEVDVQLEGIVEMEVTFTRRLVSGERGFPLDDCGGVPGYYCCLVAIGVVKDDSFSADDIEDRREWVGDWNPEAFDLEKVKKKFDLPKAKKSKAK